MRTGFAVFITAVLALGLGYATRPFVEWAVNQSVGGQKVQCVAGGAVCVGQPVSTAFGYGIDDRIGGVLDVRCGPPVRDGSQGNLNPFELMSENCAEAQYRVAFSNGRRLTNVWVDQGLIVQLDDYPRHTIDP
ncbi:hypothetical protein [uncultured Brevundimonas sp.]|uniref:hypothetical protein n=1 Tax=uncultured Brevundimonas sp. TaxID=213418 RepID=UPI0030EE1F89|tara:strand:- start:308 stop:706 length:399 start_codon:yes stop_codon:yes gene_type:complete